MLLVSLQAATLILLQFPSVQTSIARKAVSSLSDKINGRISVGNVYLVFFNKVIVKDFSIVSSDVSPLLDSLKANFNQSDTLLACNKLSVTLDPSQLLKMKLKLKTVALDGGVFNLQTESGKQTNLDRIFKLSKDTPKDTSGGSLDLLANSLRINDFRFTLNNPYKPWDKGDSIINFSNLKVRDINVNISDVHLSSDTLHACINNISGIDHSGFKLAALRGNARVSGTETLISDIYLADSYSSLDAKYFYLKYTSPKDLADFTTKVKLGIDFSGSFLNFKTIGKIAPSMYGSSLAFYLDGQASGTVNNINTDNLTVTSTSGLSFVEIDARIMGLPDVSRTMAVAQINRSSTTCRDIASIVASINNTPRNKFLASLSPFVRYNFTGSLMGLLDDFVADGTIASSIGNIDMDLLFRNETDNGVRFDGSISAVDFDMGQALSNELFGKLDLKADVNALFGSGKKGMDVTIDSINVSRFGLNGYDYSHIHAMGRYTDKYFNGTISCHDPNLDFLFHGLFSFAKESESKYDFQVYVPVANLDSLNIRTGTDLKELNFYATANFTNIKDSYLNGKVEIKNVVYRSSKGKFKLGNIKVLSLNSDKVFTASLDAPFAKAQYSGPGPIDMFIRKAADIAVFSNLDNLFSRDTTLKLNTGNYNFYAQTYNTRNLCQVIMPGLYIMDSTRLNVTIDRKNNLKAVAQSGRIATGADFMKNFRLTLTGGAGKPAKADLFSRNIRFAGMRMDSSTISLSADSNLLRAAFNFKNDSTEDNSASLLADVLFKPAREMEVDIDGSSSISLKGEKWKFTPAHISVADSCISVSDFNIANRDQTFSLYGNVSRYNPDSLNFNLKNFNIGIFNLFLTKSFNLQGFFSGNGVVSDLYREPKVFFDINGEDVSVYNNKVGTLKMMSKWDVAEKQLNILVKSNLDGKPNLSATGYYKPETSYLSMNASLEDLSVGYFEPFLEGLVSRTSGSLSGDLQLSGEFDKLSLVGEGCRFNNLGFLLDFTQVPYRLNGPFELTEKGIFFKNLPIYDKFNSKGSVNGSLTYNYFRNLALDINVDFTGMQCLNTTERDNEFFYGSAFATGAVHLKGPLEKIGIDIGVVSNNNTVIHIPLSSSANATQTNLLTFVEPESEVWIDPYDTLAINRTNVVRSETQLDVNMEARLTPAAEIMIEIDKSVGDVIRAKGNGTIDLDINPSKEVFDIFGDYHVTDGSYKFVLAGFAAKDFTLQPGGTINFNGDVTNTNLNLEAVYHTKASINPLIADTSSVSTRRNVDCIIGMEGKMMNPQLTFSINVPDLDPTTKIRVESALNTQGKVQKQLMALLVSGGFIPDEQSGIANNSSLLYSNASEILSNQINMIFQQLGIPLDLGLNYQPGERGTDIFDVAVSTQLFNNRVVINGNIGNDPYGNNSRDVIGNIDVEIKLDNPGNVRLDLFSHAEDQYSTYNDNNNSQRSGVGIVYQKEFNTFKSLLKGKSKAQKAYEKQERAKRKAQKKSQD